MAAVFAVQSFLDRDVVAAATAWFLCRDLADLAFFADHVRDNFYAEDLKAVSDFFYFAAHVAFHLSCSCSLHITTIH